VSYSRLYMGVHFIGDVIGGLILGILGLAIITPAAIFTEKYYRAFNSILTISILIIVPIIIYIMVPGHQINTTMGTLSGFLIGTLIAEDRIQFNPQNIFPYQLGKVAIGIIIIAAIRFGLKVILPDNAAFGFFRYWCIGFWCTFGAPFIFGKFSALRGE